MLYQNVCIEGMGYAIPDHVVTTDWIEEQLAPLFKALSVPKGYIERLTGIREHRWWDEGVWVSDASAMAGNAAIKDAGIDKSEVQCVINTSVCRDYIEPSTAAIVHHKMGLSPTALNFDIVNACLGFLNGMVTVANMIELGQIDTGLIVAAESPREGQTLTINRLLKEPPKRDALRDNLASFTLGAASVGMVLRSKARSKTGKRILGGYAYGNTEHCQLCVAQTDWMRTDSSALLNEGTKVVKVAWDGFKKELGWTNDIIDRVFTHQVSEPQRLVGLRAIEMPLDRDYPTVSFLGNTGAVAAPLSMALARDNGFIQAGHRVCLFGVGSGINSIILGIQW
jgi:3-oxoacyl-[acyl-carrier-protein] synthase-3